MMPNRIASLAVATACLLAIATSPVNAQMAGTYSSGPDLNGPHGATPQSNESAAAQTAGARRNVVQSNHYDRTVETNRAFRQARMRKECGPVTDPELRQSCLASFNQNESYTGSSTPRASHRSGSGR